MTNPIIAVLVWLWRVLFWIWTILIIGTVVGVLGAIGYNLITNTPMTFINPLTAPFIAGFRMQPFWSIIFFIAAVLLTVAAFLADRHLRREEEHKRTVEDEERLAKGVEKALEKRDAKHIVVPPPEKPQQPSTLPAQPTSLWSVPYRRNPFFTGRETIMQQLHDKLTTTKAAALTQTQAIGGLGGVGKTQIALEYAYRHRNDYRAVFWLRAATHETLLTDVVTLASVLALPEQNEPDQPKVVAAVKRWLTEHNHWLLILDNADDIAIADDFLPPESKGYILLTTRAQSAGKLADLLTVQEMDKQEGTLLLLRRAYIIEKEDPLAKATPEQRTQAEAIITELGGLPLALDQAAAYIEETKCTLPAYLPLYRTHRKDLLQRRSTLGPNHPAYDHPEPVATTWSLALQQLAQTKPAAVDLLRLCAFLDPDTIPEEILTAQVQEPQTNSHLHTLTDSYTLNECLESLGKYSLIRRTPAEKLIAVHRLVQAIITDEMNEEQQQQWAEQAIARVDAVFPFADVTNWDQCRRLLSNAERCASLIENYRILSEQAANFLINITSYYDDQALYQAAVEVSQQALAIREQVSGPEHPDTAQTLNNLAYLYSVQGQYQLAEPLHKRALVIREQSLGAKHPDTAESLTNLAYLYSLQGQYELAEPLYKRVLAIFEKALGTEHPNTAGSFNNLALLYSQQGQYKLAEPLYKRALAIREQVLGPEHPDTAQSFNNLALLYENQREYKLAEPLYKRALAIYEKVLGYQHPTTRLIFNHYLRLLRTMKRTKEAEALVAHARALGMKEQEP